MILGIDASNIRGGGGVTHLAELLQAADPFAHGCSQVIVWSGHATLSQIEDRPWLVKAHQPLLDKSLPYRTFWQRFRLRRLARSAGCDVLFAPGGAYANDFHPTITMSQNLLPFEWRELKRFSRTWMALKLLLLRITQAQSFHRADGLIFLTRYARDIVMRVTKSLADNITIIPHGIDERFASPPREQLAMSCYTMDHPFRVLYVSIIDLYKHQWHVAKAVAQLRANGFPVVIDLVGPAYPPALARLKKTLKQVDPAGECVRYVGAVPHQTLHTQYAQADLCLFASSCENMPNILLEGMASGLPIACSNRGPMPEMLGDAGVYFDPENVQDIARALRDLIVSPELRSRMAGASFARSQAYSWKRCAGETFGFLAKVARETRHLSHP